jgi:hypothetical protein
MPRRKRLLIILVTGSFLVALELVGFSVLSRTMGQFAHSLGTFFEDAGSVVDLVSAASKAGQSLPSAHNFKWDWRETQELKADQSLRNAELAGNERQAIAASIAAQLRPGMADLGIESEQQLRKAALDTRIKMTDLNNDGIPEVIAQGMVGCGATGNCPFWILQKAPGGYRLLLEGEAQTFTVQKTGTNGFLDIVLGRHASATESILTDNRYKSGIYQDVACYDASWTVLENDKVRELQEPLITPCNHQ